MIVNNNYVNMQSVSDTARELACVTMSECDTTPRITRGPENGNGSQDKIVRWPRRVIHCALRQMRNGTLQWNTAMELMVNGRSQWKPAAMLGVGVEQRHLPQASALRAVSTSAHAY